MFDGSTCRNSNGDANAKCSSCVTVGGFPGNYYGTGCNDGACQNPMAPWLIAVIVISVVLGVTLLALSIWWCVWVTRRNNRRQAEMLALQNQRAEMAFTNNAYDPRTQPQWGGGYPYPASNAPPPVEYGGGRYGAPPPQGYGALHHKDMDHSGVERHTQDMCKSKSPSTNCLSN